MRGMRKETTKPTVPIWVWALAGAPLIVAFWRMAVAEGTSDDWQVKGAMGDAFGGHFGSMAALSSAILFFYAVWMQHQELRAQREELQLTRDEMQAARAVHEASKRELEEQTRIAKRAALLDHIFAAATSMRSINPQPHRSKPKGPSGQEIRVFEKPEPEFIAAQMHLGMLLNDPLIEAHERDLLQEQFGLNVAYERQPGNITPSMAEILETEQNP